MIPAKNVRGLSIEVIYREQRAQLGRLNDTLYRLPPFFATVIGGLSFFASQQLEKNRLIAAGIFFFAGVCSLCAKLALQRYGVVLLAYVASIDKLEGALAPNVPKTHITTAVWFILLLSVGILLSGLGVVYALILPDHPMWLPG
jgi:hypothetical protein